MTASRGLLGLSRGKTPAGVAERHCSKCGVRPRHVGLSWCDECMAEAKRARRSRARKVD